jgi:hypothetical protein
MPGYKPKKSELCPEWHGNLNTPQKADGWNPREKTFVPIVDFDDYCAALKKKVNVPVQVWFLDEFTAAMECGALDKGNWVSAFAHLGDWSKLIDMMVEDRPYWLNERNRQALDRAFEDTRLQFSYLECSTSTLGKALRDSQVWNEIMRPQQSGVPVGRCPPRGAKSGHVHLKLV